MSKPTLLLVEDNEDLRETLSENLGADGYVVVTAKNAADLFACLQKTPVDTILLDLVLPDADGLSLISKIRELTHAPVIVVSGKGGMVDKVVGLEMGADDYVAKPFEMRELSARIKASVRRYQTQKDDMQQAAQTKTAPSDAGGIKFGPFFMDRARMQVFDETGQSLDLTIMEYRLLEALLKAPNRVMSREQLLSNAREHSPDVYDRAIDVQIVRLRKKLGESAIKNEYIRTVRGVGYMFVAQTEIVK